MMFGLPARIALALASLVLLAAIAGCGGDPTADAQAGGNTAATETPPDARQAYVGPPASATKHVEMIRGDEAKQVRAPILMYHVIAAAPAGQTYAELWTPPKRFAAQMAALKDAGFEAITMQQLMDAWEKGAPVPRQPVVLTFDDGYLSQSTAADPILKRYGWAGVLYLTARNIGASIPESSVKKMLRDGWELGAHSATHADLRTLDPAGLQREIDDVRIELRARFGQDVLSFCYPAGKYNANVIAAVKAAGFTSSTTVDPGWGGPTDDRFLLRRVRVDPTDTPQGLIAKIKADKDAPNVQQP